MVRGDQRAYWIGCGSITGKQKRLAAASSEIIGATVATAAWFRHPFFSAKALKRGRLPPDGRQSFLANVLESEPRNNFRGVTGKNLAGGIDEHQSTAPSSHTGLGKARVIVRD